MVYGECPHGGPCRCPPEAQRVVTGPAASRQGMLPIWGGHTYTRAFLLLMLSYSCFILGLVLLPLFPGKVL